MGIIQLMEKERFDFVFALGSGCACSRMLREKGLQYASFPLDWVGGISDRVGAGQSMRITTDIVVRGFDGWFEEAQLERHPRLDSPKYDAYVDRRTGLYFTHDVPSGASLHSCYREIHEKYQRRIARFLERMEASRKTLAVWVSDPRDPGEVGEDDIRYSMDALRRRYPKTEFRMLVASCRPGTPPMKAEIIRGGGYESYVMDYRLVCDGEPTWDIRTEVFDPLLGRFAARDYRTRGERRANARRERARAYEKFKAKSLLDFMITKAAFKLYRHLKRRLERKGVLAGMELSAEAAPETGG